MLRKITFALIASVALGAAALAPTAASAGGGHGHGHHGGHWGGGHWGHGHFYGGSALYIGGDSGCYQQRVVETRRGPRLRIVNVCAY